MTLSTMPLCQGAAGGMNLQLVPSEAVLCWTSVQSGCVPEAATSCVPLSVTMSLGAPYTEEWEARAMSRFSVE